MSARLAFTRGRMLLRTKKQFIKNQHRPHSNRRISKIERRPNICPQPHLKKIRHAAVHHAVNCVPCSAP